MKTLFSAQMHLFVPSFFFKAVGARLIHMLWDGSHRSGSRGLMDQFQLQGTGVPVVTQSKHRLPPRNSHQAADSLKFYTIYSRKGILYSWTCHFMHSTVLLMSLVLSSGFLSFLIYKLCQTALSSFPPALLLCPLPCTSYTIHSPLPSIITLHLYCSFFSHLSLAIVSLTSPHSPSTKQRKSCSSCKKKCIARVSFRECLHLCTERDMH